MPWLRSGDNAATYPPLLALAAAQGGDDRLLNETAGWLWRCAMQSAGHLTDGLIDRGTAYLLGGSRTPALAAAAVEAGLLVAEGQGWRLVDDPEFIHIRSRESVEFDRQRDRDRRNPDLTAPVRFRDGDACRYCGLVVNFKARTGARAGTYDHTDPGQPATVATYVVCCKGCNSKMKDGGRLELLKAPATPFYHPATIEWLHGHGLTPPDGYRSDPARPGQGLTPGGHRSDTARPAIDRDTAPVRDPDTAAEGATGTPHDGPQRDQDTAAEGATLAPQPPATPTVEDPDPWQQLPDQLDPPEPPGRSPGEPPGNVTGCPVRDGTGRDGPGRAGAGRDGPGLGGAGAAKRRRGGRGRRRGRFGGGGR